MITSTAFTQPSRLYGSTCAPCNNVFNKPHFCPPSPSPSFVVPGLRAVGSFLLTVSQVDTGYHWSPGLRVSYKQKTVTDQPGAPGTLAALGPSHRWLETFQLQCHSRMVAYIECFGGSSCGMLTYAAPTVMCNTPPPRFSEMPSINHTFVRPRPRRLHGARAVGC
jgi:hypothetical protein